MSDADERECRAVRCDVRTYREGVLSRVGHDLVLEAPSLRIWLRRDPAGDLHVRAELAAADVHARAAIKDGHEELLAAYEIKEIERAMRQEVFEADRYPRITFHSTTVARDGSRSIAVLGKLAMHGHERDLAVRAEHRDGRWSARFKIHQPDYGIKPYRAMLGALKVRADVDVDVSLEAEENVLDL